jgi:hypothetical protein
LTHAAVDLVTESGDTKCKNIPRAIAATLSLTIEAAATNIKSAASSETVVEVLPRQAGTSTQINPEASPATVDGAEVQGDTPNDTSTKVNAVASSTMDGINAAADDKCSKSSAAGYRSQSWEVRETTSLGYPKLMVI